jgi:hypothetical protein
MSDYKQEIAYSLDLLRTGEEEVPSCDVEWLISGIAELKGDATNGNQKAQDRLNRVGELLDIARSRRRWASELSRRFKV